MQQSVDSTRPSERATPSPWSARSRATAMPIACLVERHSHNVFRLAYRMTGNRHDAEEVVQEAFLRAIKSWGSSGRDRISGRGSIESRPTMRLDRMRQRQKEDARGKRRKRTTGTEWKTIH